MLVVIAHPDDEVFVSATLCLLRQSGYSVGLICVTDGEGGARLLLQPGENASRLGKIRRLEVTLSAWALGVDQLWFLEEKDIPPDEWSKENCWVAHSVSAAIAEVLKQTRPDLILTHGPSGGYGHPAHCCVNECVMRATESVAFEGSVFSFCGQYKGAFFSWRFDDDSHVLVDGRGFLARRSASLSYHQSEAQFFLRPRFPRTLRQFVSAAFGIVAYLSETGRKRIPIATTERFFNKFPVEGLVLRRPPPGDVKHFFAKHFSEDKRVRLLA